MRISVAADELTGIATVLEARLRELGHETLPHGALNHAERDDWAWAAEAAASDVVSGRADQAVICCWTGTGVSIVANKFNGVRCALCGDAQTARDARRWNNANVLALSLRDLGEDELTDILAAWFSSERSDDPGDLANIAHIDELESNRRQAAG